MIKLKLYNTLSRELENFESIHPNKVGIYVCGPTVYGAPHLGHVRGPIVFDVLRRLLDSLNYKVRFVKNITDVGHLVGDADEGEDKLQKQAKIEQIEPMEIAQIYTDMYNNVMDKMNILRPSIEPKASGHIIEQIELIQEIIEKGYAYHVNGSVYFDVDSYNKKYPYGELSGRIIEDLVAGAATQNRILDGQEEKRNPRDFALWKKASPEHLMQWTSPWGKGFPGWHIECSAMSVKYLGKQFDIHGGGMDLLFPHHECEIAQCKASNDVNPANYWIHHNMVTINGQKMAKSLNNGIKVEELFDGNHDLLSRGFSPEVLRFSVLQAHYRSTLDFSEDALIAAEKGLKRLEFAESLLDRLEAKSNNTTTVTDLDESIEKALLDDLNTPIVIAQLFELARRINLVNDGNEEFSSQTIEQAKSIFKKYFRGILGIKPLSSESSDMLNQVIEFLINIRKTAKMEKNYPLSDQIRIYLQSIGIELMDSKEGTNWKFN